MLTLIFVETTDPELTEGPLMLQDDVNIGFCVEIFQRMAKMGQFLEMEVCSEPSSSKMFRAM